MEPTSQQPPYPVGLRLAGRRVVVVGGGSVAQRRVPVLIEAGARRRRGVARRSRPALEGMAGRGDAGAAGVHRVRPRRGVVRHRGHRPTRTVNARVLAAADERRIFCVRADDAREASAWTMASGRHGQVTVAVLGNREPAAVRRAARRHPRGAPRRAAHDGRLPRPHAGRRAGRRRPGRPRAGHRRRAAGAGGGRRRGGRPAGAARAARRAERRRRAGRRRQAAARPRRRSRRRSTRCSSTARGPASGWCGSRAATPSSSAAASRRCWPAARPACR